MVWEKVASYGYVFVYIPVIIIVAVLLVRRNRSGGWIEEKSLRRATLLSILGWGLGHIYAGRNKRGATLLAGIIIFAVVGEFVIPIPSNLTIFPHTPRNMLAFFGPVILRAAGFIIFIRQIFDARNVVEEHNQLLGFGES